MRDALPDEGSFTSPLHNERNAAFLGMALGVTFTVCFLTGLVSHAHQNPPSWWDLPTRPAGLYRFSQGLHVATGIASIPLLLAKLWTVYPQFWVRPAVRNVAHAIERLALLPLVAGGVFMLFTGLANVAYWYDPMTFFFPAGHYWGAWITIGAIVVHVGAKLAITKDVLLAGRGREDEPGGDGLNRRGFLLTVGATAGVLLAATIGQTITPLRRLAVLAPRRPDIGDQGLPVNKSASQAGVEQMASSPAWRLLVEGEVDSPLELGYDDLLAMDQHEVELPIACVEGWSFSARWRGVRVRDILQQAGAREGAEVTVESLQEGGRYRTSPLNAGQAAERDALLALEVDGQPLSLDHGFPTRLIAPNRPGVQQTKWVSKLVVS